MHWDKLLKGVYFQMDFPNSCFHLPKQLQLSVPFLFCASVNITDKLAKGRITGSKSNTGAKYKSCQPKNIALEKCFQKQTAHNKESK